MTKMIEYFVKNTRLNYVLLIFIFLLGINSYIKIPKELFPVIELDKIEVSGSYTGISANNMDKLAVREIEDALDSVIGIKKIETIIKSGQFSIVLTLNEGVNKNDILNKVKDTILNSTTDLPDDMKQPIATLLTREKELLNISIGSNTLNKNDLINIAKKMKTDISKIDGISSINIVGESDPEIKLVLNNSAIEALKINRAELASQIQNLVYLFPIAEIKNNSQEIFITAKNGKMDKDEWLNTILKINDKNIRLKDIMNVEFSLKDEDTISTYNQKKNVSLSITKTDTSNAIELSKKINQLIEKEKDSNIELNIFKDSSEPIKNRLDTVISNLTLGLILVYISLHVLINARIAAVVTFGIPFSIIIGIIFIYYAGYSLNVISLLGALIVLGIVVDDAVVIAENIQRHIDEGMNRYDATIKGTREMVAPIILATITTFAAFLPMFMIQGEMGLFLVLIPIMVIMILLGSLIESIFFLPLHANELLKKSKDTINWEPLKNSYEKILRKLIKYKKTFLTLFFILVPLATILLATNMKFQFFSKFDGNNLSITAKLNNNIALEETYKIAQDIENLILSKKNEYFIKNSSLKVGERTNSSKNRELGENLFYFTLELYDRKDMNFLDKYINPILNLNFDFDNKDKLRELDTFVISKKLQAELNSIKTNDKRFEDLQMVEDDPGLIKSDIQISLISQDNELAEKQLKRLEKELSNINGVKTVTNNVLYGKDEYKITVNKFAENLGITEAYISQRLALLLGERSQAKIFKTDGLMDIIIYNDINKDLDKILNINISYNEKFYKIKDLITIDIKQDYEKIEKTNKNIVKTVFANVDTDIITATEVLNQLNETIKDIENKNITVLLEGENEKKEDLKNDMIKAVAVALFLMVASLLLIFNRMKYVYIIISVIPFSMIGVFLGHMIVGINLTMPSIIGILGLAGVVINDGIIMLDFLHGTHSAEEFFKKSKSRLRPILITTITTFLGMLSLMFFATGQAVLLQPIAISLGFGLIWGTILNLFYLPTLYALINKIDIK